MIKNQKTFAQELVEAMKKRNVKQSELAKYLKIQPQQVTKWVNNSIIPRETTILKISEYLDYAFTKPSEDLLRIPKKYRTNQEILEIDESERKMIVQIYKSRDTYFKYLEKASSDVQKKESIDLLLKDLDLTQLFLQQIKKEIVNKFK